MQDQTAEVDASKSESLDWRFASVVGLSSFLIYALLTLAGSWLIGGTQGLLPLLVGTSVGALAFLLWMGLGRVSAPRVSALRVAVHAALIYSIFVLTAAAWTLFQVGSTFEFGRHALSYLALIAALQFPVFVSIVVGDSLAYLLRRAIGSRK